MAATGGETNDISVGEEGVVVDLQTEQEGPEDAAEQPVANQISSAQETLLLDRPDKECEASERFTITRRRCAEETERERLMGNVLESALVFGAMLGITLVIIHRLVTHFCDTNDVSRASDACWNAIGAVSFFTGWGLISVLVLSLAFFAWQQGLMEPGTTSHQAVVSLSRQIWGEPDLPAAPQEEGESLLITMGSDNDDLLARIAANELEDEEEVAASSPMVHADLEEPKQKERQDELPPTSVEDERPPVSTEATPPSSAPGSTDPAKDTQDDKTIRRLFQRYDIDESGTLNTKEEFHSLTLNLLFKIKERQPDPMITPEALSVVVDNVGDIDEAHAWDPEKYASWFKTKFPRRNKDR